MVGADIPKGIFAAAKLQHGVVYRLAPIGM
jgi:hypothetical protein